MRFSLRGKFCEPESKKRSFLRAPLVLCFLFCTHNLLLAATFTVTKHTDSGSRTLRQAILNANTNSGLDTITFNISGGTGVKTITLASPLPAITSPLIIDGTTQPRYTGVKPFVEINGLNSPSPLKGR